MRDSQLAAAAAWERLQLYKGSHVADQDHTVGIADTG